MSYETRCDLRKLARLLSLYCHYWHAAERKAPVRLGAHDVKAIAGAPLYLCPACRRLFAHALAQQTHCRLLPKPACEACSQYCYDPTYRREIQDAVRDVRRTLGPRVRLGVIDPGSG